MVIISVYVPLQTRQGPRSAIGTIWNYNFRLTSVVLTLVCCSSALLCSCSSALLCSCSSWTYVCLMNEKSVTHPHTLYQTQSRTNTLTESLRQEQSFRDQHVI